MSGLTVSDKSFVSSGIEPELPKRSHLRAMLGGLKWYLIERLDDLRMQRAERLRLTQRPAIENLPTLPWNGKSSVDVCMVCGRRHFDMGIAASWSLLRFVPDWRLVVFSDGTLGPEEERIWRRVVPSMRVIRRDDFASTVEGALAGFPLLRQMWQRNRYHAQLIDAHLAGESSYLLLLDSDVLCFQKPTELIDKSRSLTPSISWNLCKHHKNCYCASNSLLKRGLEYALPDCVNAGLVLTPRFGPHELAKMEGVLERVSGVVRDPDWITHFFVAQTVYAAMAVKFPGSSPLSADYAVSTRLSRPAVMRHYVSVPGIRARYFTEGIKELLQQL
jgi:hypothetical protein